MIKRYTLAISLLLGFLVNNQAQSNALVKGTWFTPAALLEQSFEWQAQWIWLDEKTESNVLLARQSFDLTQAEFIAGTMASLRITASTHYQLYVNGQYIAQGPARSAPHHQSFDIWEIQALLQAGKNTIAVRVHHQQGKFAYHLIGRAGLLVQLDLSNGNEPGKTIVSDSSWKVAPDPSWDKEAPKISRFQLVVGDRVDLRKQIKGWNKTD
ncbi:MAG: hypothetical protein F6K19_27305, partial [Cyanothece sp. SIO1E1]|nr:hypothetical protein [Cyanothece sp. SIO1E1]